MDDQLVDSHDSSTNGLINALKEMRKEEEWNNGKVE
jgi:hypothetical protein